MAPISWLHNVLCWEGLASCPSVNADRATLPYKLTVVEMARQTEVCEIGSGVVGGVGGHCDDAEWDAVHACYRVGTHIGRLAL